MISLLVVFCIFGGFVVYVVSKVWVCLFGEVLCGCMVKKGVGVMVICSGFVDMFMVDVCIREYMLEVFMFVD